MFINGLKRKLTAVKTKMITMIISVAFIRIDVIFTSEWFSLYLTCVASVVLIIPKETLINCLCGRIAALRGARKRDIFLYASVPALRAPCASSRADN